MVKMGDDFNMNKMDKKQKRFGAVILLIAGVLASLAASACASYGERGTASRSPDEPPLWLSNPELAYPQERYVAAVGSGPDLAAAEKSALASLAGIFGQSVSGSVTVRSRYADRMADDRIISSTSDSSITEKVATSVKLDTLVGASIKETWTDNKTVYALAVMDKAETALLYAELVRANDSIINELSAQAGLKGFAEFSRLRAIAETAEATESLINVLAVTSPAQAAAMRASRTPAQSYKARLADVAATISISVNIENDRLNLLTQAFIDALAEMGFRASAFAGNADYELSGSLLFEEVDMKRQNPFEFSRGALSAALIDAATGETLLTLSITAREGHNSLSEAETRAARSLAAKAGKEFAASLDSFLSGF